LGINTGQQILFSNLSISEEAALTVALNDYLTSRSYLAGFSPTQVDQKAFKLLHRPPDPQHVHALRWYRHIANPFSYDVKTEIFPCSFLLLVKGKRVQPPWSPPAGTDVPQLRLYNSLTRAKVETNVKPTSVLVLLGNEVLVKSLH
uniref:Uncharacterized protein n=1 Tax=Neolamprologus brichardi TaxID=32507 RepID=A0A3Q4HHA9_NEOBR